jgi:hypothetical protein
LEKVAENRISDAALKKLVGLLDEVNDMVEKHYKDTLKNKGMKFVFGDTHVALYQRKYEHFTLV